MKLLTLRECVSGVVYSDLSQSLSFDYNLQIILSLALDFINSLKVEKTQSSCHAVLTINQVVYLFAFFLNIFQSSCFIMSNRWKQ